MNLFKVRVFGDPILREKARPVKKIDANLIKTVEKMLQMMRESNGVGLAANQVGILDKVAVCEDEKEGTLVLINPEIVWTSQESQVDEEGCLSLPQVSLEVERSLKVIVRALDLEGKEVEVEAEGLFARVLQHEVDHLNGKLILDRVSPEERRKALQALSEYFLEMQLGSDSLVTS
jgi:peptide deformylase